jgi:hypothetical protein
MDPRARPGSIGWVGTTAGVTEDGRFIELVDLKSEATRRKSSRPEQEQWWAETARLFSGGGHLQGQQRRHHQAHRNPDDAGLRTA